MSARVWLGIAGVVGLLADIWGAAWWIVPLPDSTWYILPALLSAGLIGTGCLIAVIYAFAGDWMGPPSL